jgi:hypothetical protein
MPRLDCNRFLADPFKFTNHYRALILRCKVKDKMKKLAQAETLLDVPCSNLSQDTDCPHSSFLRIHSDSTESWHYDSNTSFHNFSISVFTFFQ